MTIPTLEPVLARNRDRDTRERELSAFQHTQKRLLRQLYFADHFHAFLALFLFLEELLLASNITPTHCFATLDQHIFAKWCQTLSRHKIFYISELG
jgi:hypothetical protein